MSSDAKGQRAETMAVMMRSSSKCLEQRPTGTHENRTGYTKTKESIMEDFQDVTKQYLCCTDPTEAAARKQRVLTGNASGSMEETADSILAATANIRRPLSPWERGIRSESPQAKDNPLNALFCTASLSCLAHKEEKIRTMTMSLIPITVKSPHHKWQHLYAKKMKDQQG